MIFQSCLRRCFKLLFEHFHDNAWSICKAASLKVKSSGQQLQTRDDGFVNAAGYVTTREGYSIIKIISLPPPCSIHRVVVGLGEAVAPTAIVDVIARTIPAHERASATSTAFSGLHVGSIIGLLASPVIIEAWGWEPLFYIFGGAGEPALQLMQPCQTHIYLIMHIRTKTLTGASLHLVFSACLHCIYCLHVCICCVNILGARHMCSGKASVSASVARTFRLL